MMRYPVRRAVLIAFVLLLACGLTGCQEQRYSSAEEAALEYAQAVAAGDSAAFSRAIGSTRVWPDSTVSEVREYMFASEAPITVTDIEIVEQADLDSGFVAVDMDVSLQDRTTPIAASVTVREDETYGWIAVGGEPGHVISGD